MGDKGLKKDIQTILSANTVSEVWEPLLAYLQQIGFHHVLYGFTRFHTPNGFGDDKDHLFLTNFDQDYMKGYFLEGRYRHAPMIRWSIDNVGACSWGWITENMESFTKQERDVVAFNKKMGVTCGYTIAFPHALKRAKAAIGLSLEPHKSTQEEADEIWARHGEELEIICSVAHLKLVSLPLPKRMLTKRQREVLEWIGDGKTVADTAQILGLNKATVEKHLRLAREALGVETTAQAVLKASMHNQIFTF
ncbi:LuxR family transcriptional regulator [Celeribacter halophilus]|jgi:LuxR family transcriptional regulator|nr:LuxR family transcriptional regulator [Celeribacter halophilus]